MSGSARDTLLVIPNHHRTTDGGSNHPEFPATLPDSARLSYFQNRYGEQIVYVHESGKLPVLHHGDNAWDPVPVVDGGAQRLILSPAEALFVRACVLASEGE